jgi:hypothetical protein
LRKPADVLPEEPQESEVVEAPTKPFTRLPPTDSDLDQARFQAAQQRLQELGADYFVLEKVPHGSSYRFHCRIALPGSAVYARPFEVHDADPLQAMERTLADVENWCASHDQIRRTRR